jgi:hypothetical protein
MKKCAEIEPLASEAYGSLSAKGKPSGQEETRYGKCCFRSNLAIRLRNALAGWEKE